MNNRKRLLALLTALLMMVLSVSGIALAEKENVGDKTASPTALTPDNRDTTVTLSLPSDEYKNKVDVVFAMDSSTSAENSTVFIDSVTKLFNSILENNPSIELKVGVVRFRGRAHDAIDYLSQSAYNELTLYGDDTKNYIEQALTMSEAEVKAAFGSGSNTHGGIDIANEWLKADSEVDDGNKYLVLLTDGKTYIWNDDNHEPTTIYAQWYRSNSYAIQNSGRPALNQVVGYNKYDYPVDVVDPSGKSNVFVFRTIEDLLASTSEELTGVSPWDVPCLYADGQGTPTGSVSKKSVSNGAELFGSNSATYGNRKDYQYYFEYKPDPKWEGVPYLQANPFYAEIDSTDGKLKFAVKKSDGTYIFDFNQEDVTLETVNPEYYLYHVDPLQKGIYKAAKLWEEVNEKYNCAVITYEGGSADGGLQLRLPFNKWLRDNSDFGATINDDDGIKEMFKGIDNHINYLVDAGSVVTDIITDDFTLKESENPFTITVAGTTQTCTKTGDNTWNFGSDGKGGPAYEISYDPGTKTITWKINVPIMVSNQVKLSYELTLREDAETGEYPTNKSAVLDYKTTDGEDGTFTFPIPKVTYTVNLSDITVTKVWKDNENASKLRPDSITVHLLSNGDEVEKKTITQDDNWTGIFEGLPDAEYTIKEDEVEGYTASISGNSNDGFTITNAMNSIAINVTVKKVWNDNDNSLKLRPDSVTVRLLSNGKEVASRKITKTDKWTCTFENLPDGEYTVKEDAVDGYRASVTGSSKDGFTVTNTLSNQPEPSKVPTTGDGADLPLWFGLLFLGIIGLGAVAAVKGRR